MPELTPKLLNSKFDPQKLLGQLRDIVNSNKKPAEGGGKSWVSTLIIISVTLVGFAVWSWISWRRGRELAKLRHEKNKAQFLREQAALKSSLAKSASQMKQAQTRIDIAETKIRIIDGAIKAEEGRYEADINAIAAINSWRDTGIL